MKKVFTLILMSLFMITTAFTQLINEDFEGVTPPDLPMGWTSIIDASGGDMLYTYNDGSNIEALFFRQATSGDPFLLVSPEVDLSNAGDLNFDVKFGSSFVEDVVIGVGTLSDPLDPDTYTQMAQFTIEESWTDWENLYVDFSTYAGTDQHLAFKFLGTDYGIFFYLDNVVLTEGGGSGTIVFEDDIEAYTVGEMVACQNPDDWTTWANDPCGADDAYVSSDQAYSGVNSVNIITNDDLVMDLDEYLTEGKHTISVMIYVPTGGDAYYNILSSFAPAQEWAFEVYFNAGGDGAVSAGGTGAATFMYDFNTWIESKVVVDLNADWAEYYIDGELIIEWPWTAGAAGEGCALQIGALDFFGATASTTYYFDDLVFETEEGLQPPTDLTSEVVGGNDVQLNWIGAGGVGYIQWDAGINTGNGIGLTSGGTFNVASHWLPDDLTPYDGLYMTSITIFPNMDPDATFVLKAWTGPDAGTEILSQDVASVTIDEFNEITLVNPIQIDASQELWFGYAVTHNEGTNPAGVDEGPAIQGFGDMISIDGSNWVSMGAEYGLDFNWNIAGYLSESSDGKSLAQPMAKQPMKAATGSLVASGSNGTMNKMDKKSTKDFIGFNVYRDNEIIAQEILETSYLDIDLLPGTYSFDVKAVYDEGISNGAGPVEETILGGVERDLVLLEIGTGTWCGYCPGAAMGADDLVANGKQVGVIEYHGGDDYETPEATARLESYYGITGYPTAWFDGVITVVGGSATQTMYPTYLPKYETRIAIPSLFTMSAEYYNTGSNNYQVVIDAEMISEYPWLDNDIVIQAVLTESEIPENWGVMDEVNFVCRDMIPDQNGTDTDFGGSSTQTLTLDFTIPTSYEMQHLELIVFIQDNDTKEVLQANFAEYITGIENIIDENEIAVYPNPANDIVNVTSGREITNVKVYNNTGQLVSNKQVNSNFYQLNTSQFDAGIYLFQIESNEGVTSKRIIIQ